MTASKYSGLTTKHYERVVEFMEKAEQDVPTKPQIPDMQTRKLRARLILEEALETIEALGFVVESKHVFIVENKSMTSYQRVDMKTIDINQHQPPNMIKIIDGCCDLKVVTTGTLISCGVPDELYQIIVDDTNLTKFSAGSYRDQNGKWRKPPNWTGPEDQIRYMLEMGGFYE